MASATTVQVIVVPMKIVFRWGAAAILNATTAMIRDAPEIIVAAVAIGAGAETRRLVTVNDVSSLRLRIAKGVAGRVALVAFVVGNVTPVAAPAIPHVIARHRRMTVVVIVVVTVVVVVAVAVAIAVMMIVLIMVILLMAPKYASVETRSAIKPPPIARHVGANVPVTTRLAME